MRESVFLLPLTAEYALRALGYIAERGGTGYVRVRDIAVVTEIPHNYLSKTLHQLARAGILESARGPSGGFRLASPAEDIPLSAVLDVFGEEGRRKCLLGRGTCGERLHCALHVRWQSLSTQLWDFLGDTTVARLTSVSSHKPEVSRI